MKLSANGQKILKVVHLVSAIAWIGSAIVMNLLRHLVEVESPEAMYYVAAVLEAIDMDILVPAAILCLITGLIYGLFTPWGFFKHGWLVFKWVFTVLMILFGTFYMGPRVSDNVAVATELLSGGGEEAAYLRNVADCAWSGAVQIFLLGVIVVVSVFKPRKKGKHKRSKARS